MAFWLLRCTPWNISHLTVSDLLRCRAVSPGPGVCETARSVEACPCVTAYYSTLRTTTAVDTSEGSSICVRQSCASSIGDHAWMRCITAVGESLSLARTVQSSTHLPTTAPGMGRQQRTSRSCLRESRRASSRAARRTRTANIAPQSQAIWSAIDRCHGGAHEYDGGTLCSGSMSLRRQSSSLGQSSACNWRTTRPATRALASTSGMSRAQRREKRSVRGAAREWRPTRASALRARLTRVL